MKKILIFAAATAFALASCTTSDDFFAGSEELAQQEVKENAIQFGTFISSGAQTRAGATGSIDTDKLKGADYGFGVFAYYTGIQTYNTYTSYAVKTDGTTGQTSKPANFMFNQKVYWYTPYASDGHITAWYYSPMKYWPNEVQSGAVDDQDKDTGSDPATTNYNNGGNLTFFAYAPYVAFPLSGPEGIIAINGETALTSANVKNQDPIITYKVPASGDNMVDLLWGTKGSTDANVHGLNNGGASYNGTASNYEQSILPHYTNDGKTASDGYILNADLTKQKTNGKVDFAFKHALAKVGGSETYSNLTTPTHGLMVIADIDDQKGAETGGDKSSSTKITITDVQITARALYDFDKDKAYEADEYMKNMQGDLNLATGQWGVLTTSNNGTSAEAATTQHNITSPASDGSLASSATLADAIAEPASVGTTWTNVPDGVLTTAQNVYKNEANPLVFIPGTLPELTIRINYTVRSNDANLAAGAGRSGEGTWTYVNQVITKKVTFTKPVELNKQYSLLMHLGLTSVKFTASVSDWQVEGDTDGSGAIDGTEVLKIEDVHLPINVGVKAVALAAGTTNILIPSAADECSFNLTDLTDATDYTVSTDLHSNDGAFDPNANFTSDGTSQLVSLTGMSVNKTINNKTRTITVNSTTIVNIIQHAGELGVTTTTPTQAAITDFAVTVKDAADTDVDVASLGGTPTLTILKDGADASITATATSTGFKFDLPENDTASDITWTLTVSGVGDTEPTTITFVQPHA